MFSAEFPNNIRKAIQFLESQPLPFSDAEVLQLLRINGVPDDEAFEIILFLPISFVMLWLPNLDWPDSYLEVANEVMTVRKFIETASFQIIWEVAGDYFKNNPTQEGVVRIGARSAAFDAINNFLNDGGNMEDLKIEKTKIFR